jgi:hypothetical protein
MFHQFGSIGSGTGVLIGVGWAETLCCDENQLAGDHMDCFFQLGPTVQPGSKVLASNAKVSQPGCRAAGLRTLCMRKAGRLLRKVRLHI